jgi:hypothetical protein
VLLQALRDPSKSKEIAARLLNPIRLKRLGAIRQHPEAYPKDLVQFVGEVLGRLDNDDFEILQRDMSDLDGLVFDGNESADSEIAAALVKLGLDLGIFQETNRIQNTKPRPRQPV